MLSEKLNRNPFADAPKRIQRANARKLLGTTVKHLVASMRCVEEDGIMTREQVEAYVLSTMEQYEKMLYSMDKDTFEEWLTEQAVRSHVRRRHHD